MVEVLRKYLHCVDHLDVDVEEYEYGADEARRLKDFAVELIRVCYVQTKSSNFAGDDEDDDQPQTKRSERADAFISFSRRLGLGFCATCAFLGVAATAICRSSEGLISS